MNNIMKLITVASILCFSTGCTKPAGSSSTAPDQTATPEATVTPEKPTSFPIEMDSTTAFNNFIAFINEENYTIERIITNNYVFPYESLVPEISYSKEMILVESLKNPCRVDATYRDGERLIYADGVEYSLQNGECYHNQEYAMPSLGYDSCTIDSIKDLSLTPKIEQGILEFTFTDFCGNDKTVRAVLDSTCVPLSVSATCFIHSEFTSDSFSQNAGKKYVLTIVEQDIFRDIGTTVVNKPQGCIASK